LQQFGNHIVAIIIRRLFSNGVLWSFLYIATIIVE